MSWDNPREYMLKGATPLKVKMEREKQREKERQSRQQQVQSENNVKDKKELFGSPVKVDDANDDEQSQLIQSQLGSFDDAKPFLDLVFSCGMTGMPPSPAPPPPQSSSSSSSAAASGMMHHHSSSYASSAQAAAAAKSHHHAAAAAAAAAASQQQSSRRSESPASGSVPAAVGSFKKPTVTSHAMARSSSGGGSSSSASHFQPPVNPPRNSNFLKPGEMKPPSYSSMGGRSTSGGGSSGSSMRSSHSSHHRAPSHKPNNNLAVSNNHNSNNDTNTPSTIEDILNEMTVGLPLVSDIAETPRVTIVDSKYTADGKVEPPQRMSPKDASENLKNMLGEPKPLFAEPVQHSRTNSGGNQHLQQPSSRGVSPDAASSAAAASMDAKPSGPYNHSLFASYMVKPSVRGSNIMPQPQQSMMQESQQQSSPSAGTMRRGFTSANIMPSDPANNAIKNDKAISDMSVDEDSSSSEEGEKDSSSDSSCSDSDSNDEASKKDEQPAAVSPPQQEEEQPRWYLKNFLKRSTPDTNNTTRASQQDESIGMTDPKSSPGFLETRSEVNERSEMSDDSDSNHSEPKPKIQSDSSSSSSTSSSSSEDEDEKKKKNSESSCDSDSSCSSRSRASAKPLTDLHIKYKNLAKYEKKEIKKPFEKPAKPTEKKQSTPVIPKKEEPVNEPVKKRRGRKKGSTNTPKPPPPSKIKSKPLISSDSEDDEEPAPKPKISEKRRGRPPGKKIAKVISASSESEEWTDSSRKSRKKDSEKKLSSHHSVKKTPSWEKNPPQKPVARVSAALRPPRSVSSSVDSDSSDVECRPPPISTATESPPKLDVEGIKVQDKKKNDTLRKLFRTRREEGGIGGIGGKSKGGKGGKGGVIIIDNNEAMRNDNERVISPVPVIPPMPKEPEGPKSLSMMSILCSIPLSKLPNLNYLLKSARSKELRTCADLANTRQTEEKKPKHRHHKHHHKGSPAQSVSGSEKSKPNNESQANTVPPTQPLLQQPSSDGYTKGMMDNVNVWRKPTSVCAVIPEAKVKPLEHNTMSYLQRPSTGSGLMHAPYEDSSDDEDGPAPFLYGATAVQIMDPRYKRSLELDQYAPPNATKRRKFHNPPGPATLGRYGTAMGDGLINDIFVDHEVPIQPPPRQPSWRMQSMHHQYPPRKRFFSYFVTDLYPENNSMHQEVPLKEAQALTKLAEYEPDPITQEMKYLDGILCFVLSGYLMENDGTRERAVLKIYNDTIDLIKVIWSKIYNYRADCDHEELEEIFEMANNPERDNRLLILWMRCLSFLRLKLYRLLTYQHRPSFKTVQQHFLKNVGSSPISPSPSPASSVESHSSGYCSSSITPSGVAASSGPPTGVIGVPIAAHTALHSEHILFCHLAAAHEMWYRADMLVMRGKHTQFFVEMDRHCGPLTLHSTGYDLTLYARIAISRMRCEFNIKNYLP